MSEERFDLVFSGELVAGFEAVQVKKNIQALFRIDEAKINVLFSGKAVPLKKGLDADTANKYRVAMKKAGARVDVVLNRDIAPAPKPTPIASTATASPGPAVVANQNPRFSTALGAQPAAAATPRAPISAPDFGVAAPGSGLLKPEERRKVAVQAVDISHLSVVPQQGNLLRDDELDPLPDITVTVPNLDVAAVGSDLLLPEERLAPEPVAVDISRLTLGKVGERLAPPSPRAPPPPNVDHIKLK